MFVVDNIITRKAGTALRLAWPQAKKEAVIHTACAIMCSVLLEEREESDPRCLSAERGDDYS